MPYLKIALLVLVMNAAQFLMSPGQPPTCC